MKKVYFPVLVLILLSTLAYSKPLNQLKCEQQISEQQKMIDRILFLKQQLGKASELKSGQAAAKMLEKITLSDGGNKLFEYNSKGQSTDYQRNEYEKESSAYVLNEHNTISYDSKGNKVLQIFNTLISDALVLTEKDEWAYDVQNRETEHINSVYDSEISLLVYESKTLTSYTSDQIVTEEYSWDKETSQWILISKTEINYSENRMIGGTTYARNEDTGVIEKTMVYELTYDSQNRIIRMLTKAVDSETGNLADMMLIENTYDSNGNEVLSQTSMFEPESGQWMTWSKSVSNFNSNGQLVSDEYYSLDWMTFSLKISDKHEYNYSGNQLAEEIVWESEYFNGTLTQSFKFLYTYDNSIDAKNLILPESSLEDNAYNDLQSEFVFSFGALANVKWLKLNFETMKLEQYREATYHYKGFAGSLADRYVRSGELKVGPNPFWQVLTIRIPSGQEEQISVFNSIGQTVYEMKACGEVVINSSLWQPGLYIVKWFAEGSKPEMIKMIKR